MKKDKSVKAKTEKNVLIEEEKKEIKKLEEIIVEGEQMIEN